MGSVLVPFLLVACELGPRIAVALDLITFGVDTGDINAGYRVVRDGVAWS